MKTGSLRQGIVKLIPALRFAVGTFRCTVCSLSSNETNPLYTRESCTVVGTRCKKYHICKRYKAPISFLNTTHFNSDRFVSLLKQVYVKVYVSMDLRAGRS